VDRGIGGCRWTATAAIKHEILAFFKKTQTAESKGAAGRCPISRPLEAAVITASEWGPLSKGALRGFVDLELQPSGLVLHGCTLMESNGRRWIGLPARPQLHQDGSAVISPKTGKPAWTPIIEIKGREEKERFQTAALVAVDKLLGRGSAP
jgi:hypothetical protein